MKITRKTELREAAFIILFRADYYDLAEMPGQIKSFFADEEEFNDREKQFVSERVLNVCEKIPEIDEALDRISVGWKVRRMNHADLTALRLAYYEIMYDEKVPLGAAINDAVELAKNYGTDNSGSFVNGILAKVANLSEKKSPDAPSAQPQEPAEKEA
ncbi:MAG: transcription antitermination factor NusB [Parasporobacterium sp.]|nr:transcription antitermination factor NusB [Parasporobacterium sp.]